MSVPWAADVDRGDLDEAVRWVDRLVDTGEWDELVELRQRCRSAHDRGHQLWPAACYAAHHLALGAPAPLAAAVLNESDSTHFGLGPLWEVAASTHTWDQLRPHLRPGPTAALVAGERVLRGESIDPADVPGGPGEVPLELAPVEPEYPIAVYRADRVQVDGPPEPPMHPLDDGGGDGSAEQIDDDAEQMWRLIVQPWLEQSAGTLRCVTIVGSAAQAIVQVGGPRARTAPVDLGTVLAHLQWAAASGGGRGRRRGGAVGRTLAWWAVATLAGSVDEWPLTGDELGRWGGELEWWLWQPAEPSTGWQLRLAAADPPWNRAWAVEAVDDGALSVAGTGPAGRGGPAAERTSRPARPWPG